MAVQNGYDILRFREAAFEAFHRLRRKRNFRNKDDRGFPARESRTDRLQINFRLAAAGYAVKQNRFRVFWRGQRFLDRAQGRRLFRIQGKVGGCDELLVGVRIPRDRLLAQGDKAALLERAQSLIIQRSLPEKFGGGNGLAQFRDRFEQLRLARSAPPQFLDVFRQNFLRGADEQSFFPADLRLPDHLRQKTPHDRLDRAAIIGAHPARQLDEFRAQCRPVADERFDGANAFRGSFIQQRNHRSKRRFFTERHPYPGPDRDAFRERLRQEIIELAMDRAIYDDARVGGFAHLLRILIVIVLVLLLVIDYLSTKVFRSRARSGARARLNGPILI